MGQDAPIGQAGRSCDSGGTKGKGGVGGKRAGKTLGGFGYWMGFVEGFWGGEDGGVDGERGCTEVDSELSLASE